MTKVFPTALVIALASLPVFAQSGNYSIDNFDMRTGVQVQQPQATPRIVPAKSGRARKSSTSKQTATDTTRLAVEDASLVKPTVMLTGPIVNPVVNVGVSSLRGYTTGNGQVDGYLIQSGTNNGVDPLLLYSVMHQESSFKSGAISPKGARGLMQLMPGTAARYGVTNIFDPKQNIEGGARYLRFLLDHFDGDLNLALAGYNAGEGAVEKYGWRIPPYSETQEYVRRISRRYSLLQDPNAALYAPRLSRAQVARLQSQAPTPLALYERTVSTVRLPDGRLQLMSQ